MNVPSNLEIVGGYKQNFTDTDPAEVTTIFGTATSPAAVFSGVTGSKISAVSLQGVTRTSGDAVGVLIFSGLTAYDTQKIKESYAEGDEAGLATKKQVMGALELYLDFINLFLMLLRLLGDRR